MIGSKRCDLFTNHTIFCSKSHLFLSQWEWESKQNNQSDFTCKAFLNKPIILQENETFQIKLALRARSILKSRVWFQTKLHSTQFTYHYKLESDLKHLLLFEVPDKDNLSSVWSNRQRILTALNSVFLATKLHRNLFFLCRFCSV